MRDETQVVPKCSVAECKAAAAEKVKCKLMIPGKGSCEMSRKVELAEWWHVKRLLPGRTANAVN